jgi:cephalosporin hydroxylase
LYRQRDSPTQYLAIQAHPLSQRIQLIEKDALDSDLVPILEPLSQEGRTMVSLDSNHAYDHVLAEMNRFGAYVSEDSYMVVMDGIQKMLGDTPCGDPAWFRDNPLRAVHTFLEAQPRNWEVDPYCERLKITCAPHGFLKKRAT